MTASRMTTGTRWNAPEGTVTIVAVREGIVVAMDEAGNTFREVRSFAERVWTSVATAVANERKVQHG